MWHKKISLVYCASHFILGFYITHCQHVDLLRVVLETKKLLIHHLLTCLIYPSSYWVRVASEKRFLYLGLMIVKRLRGAHILVKLQACFSQILQKLIPRQVFFKDFTWIFSNFLLYAIFPEDFPMTDSIDFKISFQ